MGKHLATAVAVVLGTSGPAGADKPPLRIDDFEDMDLEAATGLSWIEIGDWQLGGGSSGAVSVGRPSAGNRSRGALRLGGRLRSAAPATIPSFAGVWASLCGDGSACEMPGYRALRFRVRGVPGRYLAGIRRTEGRSAANFMAPVDVTAAWAVVTIPFDSLEPQGASAGPSLKFATSGLGWLGFTTGATSPREFALEIDDIEIVPDGPESGRAMSMRKVVLTDSRSLDRLRFATVGRDLGGDGVQARLPDARELQMAVDASDQRVWFRFLLAEPPPPAWFGMNVAIDCDGDPDSGGPWWGQNKSFHFDLLLTSYLSRGAGYWQGSLGVADSAQVGAGRFDGRSADVKVAIDRTHRWLAIGAPRAALCSPSTRRVRLIGTVGSNFTFNDDVPAEGALEVEIPPVQ